jgi:hypothetical protein
LKRNASGICAVIAASFYQKEKIGKPGLTFLFKSKINPDPKLPESSPPVRMQRIH